MSNDTKDAEIERTVGAQVIIFFVSLQPFKSRQFLIKEEAVMGSINLLGLKSNSRRKGQLSNLNLAWNCIGLRHWVCNETERTYWFWLLWLLWWLVVVAVVAVVHFPTPFGVSPSFAPAELQSAESQDVNAPHQAAPATCAAIAPKLSSSWRAFS